MQIEGFWYCLFLGVFEAATIRYAVAKIFGPLLFGRSDEGCKLGTDYVLDVPYRERAFYYIADIALAFIFKDNRAFCKYLCLVTAFLKPMSCFSLLCRTRINASIAENACAFVP